MRFIRCKIFVCSLPLMAALLTLPCAVVCSQAQPQISSLYANLPVGKYSVGFKIITLIDNTRDEQPEYNYLGEKNKGDRSRKITIHLWYPAAYNAAKKNLNFEDYCYNDLLRSVADTIPAAEKNTHVAEKRNAVERWFGKTTDDAWRQLLQTGMLAQKDADPVNEKFPLLIGALRPLSTSITNEMLASNGYVVAMIWNAAFESFSNAALYQIPDIQFAINYLIQHGLVDASKIGTFGFSGSGFIPVLFGMFDNRVKAMADIESGIYMEGLYQGISASNYYQPSKLRIPFLHIFSRDLSQQEKYINEFEKKTKFSKRYRLLLNQPALHHWDFATEGYVSGVVLKMRGAQQNNIKQSFEIASEYLLHFFNAELKGDTQSKIFLSAKPNLPQTASSLWDITMLDPLRPAPTDQEFEYIISKKGIDSAVAIARSTIPNDSSTNLLQDFILNRMGYDFLNSKKYKEAIAVFKLNTELHPYDANLFDSLAEGYETTGDKEHMKKAAQKVLDILAGKTTLTESEQSLKQTSERRIKM